MKFFILTIIFAIVLKKTHSTFSDESCHVDKASKIDPKIFQNHLQTEIIEIIANKDDFEHHKTKCEDLMNYSNDFINNANNCLDEKFKSLFEFIHGITISLSKVLCGFNELEFHGLYHEENGFYSNIKLLLYLYLL